MELSELLSQCLSYPSGDNCQPFRFHTLGSNEFEIHHDDEIARHRLNFSNIASCLSFGTLLETISLVSINMGFQAQIETFLPACLSTRGLQKWAKVSLIKAITPVKTEERQMYEALGARAAHRGRYESETLPEEVVRWLEADACNNPNLIFSFQNRLSADLTLTLLNLEQQAWKDPVLFRDITKWIRFSRTSATKSRDGMTWGSLGLPVFQKPLLKLVSLFPTIHKVSANLGATAGQRNTLAHLLKHSGGFGWIALASQSHADVISAGRTYNRMWLYLTARGYAFQPLSLATFPAFAYHFQGLPPDWPKRLHPYYPKVIELIQRDAKIDAKWIPLWGFRTGKADAIPIDSRCLRKSLNQVSV